MSKRMIQNIFKSCADQLEKIPQPLKNRKAIFAITHCRTAEMGVSYYCCAAQHDMVEQYHSCRNRSCYQCSSKTKIDWVEQQKRRLLNVPHFHLVFTLPHEYLPLWRYNEKLFTHLLFTASQKTLLELMGDSKYGPVTPGILMALHTWGRQLNLHPHIHCLVTGGGLTASGEWRDSGDYLLPIRVVKSLYRGKLQALLREAFELNRLVLPPDMSTQTFWQLYRSTYKKAWSVRIEERYAHGKGVMLYLSRYLKGGPVHPKQITFEDKRGLGLRYLDHRDKRYKMLFLSPMELISKLLQHVPPMGTHIVRYYGLYSASSKGRLCGAVKDLGTLANVFWCGGLSFKDLLLSCRVCGSALRLSHCFWRQSIKGISINKEGALRRAQQEDDADFVNMPLGRLCSFSSA